MMLRKFLASAVALPLVAMGGIAHAAEPTCETAKLIVPWKAGGGTQVIFAIVEQTIQKLPVKTKLQVVTIPGQGGNKGAKEAARAKADGCTLFAIHQSAITSYLNGRINFSFENFETVANLTATPDIVGAAKSVPYKSYAEFQEAALKSPGTMKVGATFGSTSQFMWLLLEEKTGMKFKYVPYDGTRDRMTAILSGAIDLGTLNVAAGRKYLTSGELKGFAIADDKRSRFLPDMPTLKEVGVDLVFALQRGIVAPKGTPKDAIDYWANVIKQVAENKDFLAQMEAKGTYVRYQGPADYRAWADKTMADYKAVAKKIGMYKGK